MISYTSNGTAPAHTVALVDAVPPDTQYLAGSASASGPAAVIEFSHDGGSTWDASQAAPVTHVRFRLAAPLAPGVGGSVRFDATVR